jgi:hypothetical protein
MRRVSIASPSDRDGRSEDDWPISPRSRLRTALVVSLGVVLIVGLVTFLAVGASPSHRSAGFRDFLPEPIRNVKPLLTHSSHRVQLGIYDATSTTSPSTDQLTLFLTSSGSTVETGSFSLGSPISSVPGLALLYGGGSTWDIEIYEITDKAISRIRARSRGVTLDQTTLVVIGGISVGALVFQNRGGGAFSVQGLDPHGRVVATSVAS